MKIYVINLEEATERRAKIKEEMKKTSLYYEFITPIKSEKIKEVGGWTTGANSLRLTTIELIKKAIKDKEDKIWIWEDDCVIDELKFNMFMDHLPSLKSFHFIHLNYSGGLSYSLQNIKCFRKTLDGVYNCQSYIIHNSIFEDYLKELENLRPIDDSCKILHKRFKNSYIVEPNPVSHTPNLYSTIRKKIVHY